MENIFVKDLNQLLRNYVNKIIEFFPENYREDLCWGLGNGIKERFENAPEKGLSLAKTSKYCKEKIIPVLLGPPDATLGLELGHTFINGIY